MRRGFLLLGSFSVVLGLLVWRIRLVARRYDEVLQIFLKALSLEPFLIIVVLSVVVLWLYHAITGNRSA